MFLLSLSMPLLAEASFPIKVWWGRGGYPCPHNGICHIGVPDPGPSCPLVDMFVSVQDDNHLLLYFPNPPQQADRRDISFSIGIAWPIPHPEVYGYKSMALAPGSYNFNWKTNQVVVNFRGERDNNTLFSNLDNSVASYQCCTGITISGSRIFNAVSNTVADQFQPIRSGAVSQIDVAVGYVSGANSFYVGLYTDGNGMPGTLLGQWSNLSSGTSFGNCCGLVSITGISGISLTAGESYFLVVGPTDPASTTYEQWNLNVAGSTGVQLYSHDGGNSWSSSGQQMLGGFDVTGGN
jgi:hypothetical protein